MTHTAAPPPSLGHPCTRYPLPRPKLNNNTVEARTYPLTAIHEDRGFIVAFSPRNSLVLDYLRGDHARRLFARMLEAAFPEPSENAIAQKAAPVLGVTERHVRKWLRLEHDAKIRHFVAVTLIIGVEKMAQMIEGGNLK